MKKFFYQYFIFFSIFLVFPASKYIKLDLGRKYDITNIYKKEVRIRHYFYKNKFELSVFLKTSFKVLNKDSNGTYLLQFRHEDIDFFYKINKKIKLNNSSSSYIQHAFNELKKIYYYVKIDKYGKLLKIEGDKNLFSNYIAELKKLKLKNFLAYSLLYEVEPLNIDYNKTYLSNLFSYIQYIQKRDDKIKINNIILNDVVLGKKHKLIYNMNIQKRSGKTYKVKLNSRDNSALKNIGSTVCLLFASNNVAINVNKIKISRHKTVNTKDNFPKEEKREINFEGRFKYIFKRNRSLNFKFNSSIKSEIKIKEK